MNAALGKMRFPPMGKRKRKKSGRGKGFSKIASFLGETFHLFFRVFPFVALGLILGLLFFGVRRVLYADSSLTVQKIMVDPIDGLSSTERQSLESRLLGKNILKIDVHRVAKELEKDPEIQIARVTRHLPSLLQIEVEKRKPIAFIQLSPRGSFGLISEDGMILDVVRDHNTSLVLVEAYGLDKKEPHMGLKVKQKGFQEAMKFLKAFWEHPLAHQETVTKMSLDHLGNVSVILGSGPEIRLGRQPFETLGSIEKIIPLLEGENRKGIEYVDLQFDNVIVKRKK